jgi:hypothetical protein
MQPAGREKHLVALMAGMNLENTALETFYLLPRGWISNRFTLNISIGSRWLKRSARLSELSAFCDAAHLMSRKKTQHIGNPRLRPKGWLSPEAKKSIASSQRLRWAAWRKVEK